MRTGEAAALLARTQLFGDLDQPSLDHLADECVEHSYKKGEAIFSEGDAADNLFVVVEGVVKVFVTSDEGDQMVLTTFGPSEVFGELALVDSGPRSASAEAVEPTTLLSLNRESFLELHREHPEVSESLDRSLGALLRRLTEQASDLVFLDLQGRVAKLLLVLAENQAQHAGTETAIDLHITQTDLASMVGGARQSVNQILRSFERQGYLELHGRKILLKKPEPLRRRAGIHSPEEA